MSNALKTLRHRVGNYAPVERGIMDELCTAFDQSRVPIAQRLQTFPRHVRRQDFAHFLVKHELFRLSLPANGSVVECGVFAGGGLLGWMHFSAIHKPCKHTQGVTGFDISTGFPEVHEEDRTPGASEHTHAGAFHTHDSIVEELRSLVAINDRSRSIGHTPKVELAPGDAYLTIPRYLDEHPPTSSSACCTWISTSTRR